MPALINDGIEYAEITFRTACAEDEIVPFEGNSKILIDYCGQHDIQITSIVKPDCKHHPHSLEDVGPILDFVKR